MAKRKTTIGRLRELAIKRINMQLPKHRRKFKNKDQILLDERRRKLLQKIAKTTDMRSVVLSEKEKISFRNEIKQKGGLIKWARAQSQKDSIDKGTPPKKYLTKNRPKTIGRNIDSFMKESKIDKIWKKFCKLNLQNTDIPPRLGSKRIQAKGYINVKNSPMLPIKQLSTEVIFEGWGNGYNKEIAKNIIDQEPSLSFQELLIKIIILMSEDEKIYIPYIWWIDPDSHTKKKRLIYQDVDGDNFVKIDNKWQMVYSVKSAGSLVGRQGGSNYEDLNLHSNSYFVVWENEDDAKNYSN